MRTRPWPLLSLVPLVGLVVFGACATGEEGDGWTGPGKSDASVGGAAGASGGAGTAGEAGGSSEGGSAGNAGGSTGGSAGKGGGAGQGGSAGSTGGSSGAGGSSGKGGAAGTGGAPCTPPVSGGLCDTVPQCGCPAGQACDVAYVGGETKCFATQNIAKGNPCDDLGVCAPGLTCVGTVCRAFCENDSTCGTVPGACFDVMYDPGDGGSSAIPEMHVCTDQCDLRTSQGCPSGITCVPFDDLGVTGGRSVCVVGGTSTGACSATLKCAPGYACMGDDQCHRWCRASTDSDCASGETCYQLTDPDTLVDGYYYVGNQGFGVCAP